MSFNSFEVLLELNDINDRLKKKQDEELETFNSFEVLLEQNEAQGKAKTKRTPFNSFEVLLERWGEMDTVIRWELYNFQFFWSLIGTLVLGIGR